MPLTFIFPGPNNKYQDFKYQLLPIYIAYIVSEFEVPNTHNSV